MAVERVETAAWTATAPTAQDEQGVQVMPTTAGWYPDPQVERQRRYWDGQKWTDRRAPVVIPRSSPYLEQVQERTRR